MTIGGQLNIHSYRNQHSRDVQTVRLFHHQELRAELLVLPPGTTVDWHSHQQHAELLDVVEGEGHIAVGDGDWRAPAGKCILVMAGEHHRLHNESDAPWVVRSTLHEELRARDIGRLVRRAVRRALRVPA